MRVLPHVVGPHREIAESHVFEDVMQLVDLVREGAPTAANPEHALHVIDIIESGYRAAETRPDPGAGHELRSGAPLALGIDVGMSGVRAAVVDERGGLLGSGRAGSRPRAAPWTARRPTRGEWLVGALSAAGSAAAAQAGAWTAISRLRRSRAHSRAP